MNFLYDINGNIYMIHNDDYYLITINNNDYIELEKILHKNINNDIDKNINNDIDKNINNNIDKNINNNIDIDIDKNDNNKSMLNKINKQNNLHIKSIENAINELDDYEDDDDKDKFNDIYDKYNSYIYNPEQRFYHCSDDDNDDSDDYDFNGFIEKERKIKLYSDINPHLSQTDFFFDIPMYEALIISGDLGTNNLIFRTEIINDQALYRLTIYTNGIILLNIIGTKIVKFIINPETLEITKEHYQYIKIK